MSTNLSYYELQQLRQQNINDALQSPDTTADRLIQLHSVAVLGVELAFHQPDIGEFDTLTFIGLQRAIRDKLYQSPAFLSAQAQPEKTT